MTRKYLGRLAGNNPVGASSTAPASTVTPYSAQAVAAKFRSYGEGATADQHNRALTAIQQNIEDVLNTLDAPTVARARVVAKMSTFGSEGLVAVPHGTDMVDLGALDGDDAYPVQWVYCGLHQQDLAKYVRAYRYTGSEPTEYEDANPTDANNMLVACPSAALTQTGALVFDVSAGYLTGSPHAPIDRVPPLMQAVGPAANAPTLTIAAWDRDGPTFAAGTRVDQAYGRVGCFLKIDVGENRGMYRIVAISRKDGAEKVVLSTGGLHRIDVLDASSFTDGSLVYWNNDGGASGRARQFGYVVHIDGDSLYVSDMPGEEDYVSNDGTHGQKVGTNGELYTSYWGALQYGSIGLYEAEAGATQNASLVVDAYSTITTAYDYLKSSVITAIRPAGYPIVFDTAPTDPGTATVWGPLGFVLNPKFHFAAAHAHGNYLVECKTLTTVREKLTALAGPSRITQNIDADLGFTEQDVQRLKAFARYVKTGSGSAAERESGDITFNDAFAAPAQLLGENMWVAEITCATPGGVPLSESVEIVSAASGGTTTAVVVSASDTHAVLCDVSIAAWTADQLATAWTSPLEPGDTFWSDGREFTLGTFAYRPVLRAEGGTPFVPRGGLQGAYDAAFDAAQASRGPGFGSTIVLADARPFTLLKRAASTDASFYSAYSGGATPNEVDVLRWVSAAGKTAAIGASNTTGALLLGDTNTDGYVPFSSAGDTALQAELPQNLLGAINALAARGCVTVGPLGQFQTLREAVAFVNAADLASPAVAHRRWRIVLEGPTVETQQVLFTAGDVVVEGALGSTEYQTISWNVDTGWTGDTQLINLNGKNNITFRDVSFVYAGTRVIDDALADNVVFTCGASKPTGIMLDNITITCGGSNLRLKGYFDAENGCDDLTISNCRWAGATDFGIRVLGGSNMTLNSVSLSGQLASSQTGTAGGLICTDVSSIHVDALTVTSWQNYGVRLTTCIGGSFNDTTVDGVAANDLCAGVYLEGVTNVSFRKTYVHNVVAGISPAYGVAVDPTSSFVVVDDAVVDTVASAVAAGTRVITIRITPFDPAHHVGLAVNAAGYAGTVSCSGAANALAVALLIFLALDGVLTDFTVTWDSVDTVTLTQNISGDFTDSIDILGVDMPVDITDTPGSSAAVGIRLSAPRSRLFGCQISTVAGEQALGWAVHSTATKCFVDQMQAGGAGYSPLTSTTNSYGTLLRDDA